MVRLGAGPAAAPLPRRSTGSRSGGLLPSSPYIERSIQENSPAVLLLPISLRRPEMVRLGAALMTERVLSMEARSSTQALLCKIDEDTASSVQIVMTMRRKPDDRGEEKMCVLLSRKTETQTHMARPPFQVVWIKRSLINVKKGVK